MRRTTLLLFALLTLTSCGTGSKTYTPGYGNVLLPSGGTKAVPGMWISIFGAGRRANVFVSKPYLIPRHQKAVECWEEGAH